MRGGSSSCAASRRATWSRQRSPGRAASSTPGHWRSSRPEERALLRRAPILGPCGGGPLHPVASSGQLSPKEALLADALERIGGFPRESYELRRIVPSPRELRYRRRARLHRGRKGTWGFAGELADGIVPVDDCPLFEEPLQRLFEAVRGFDLPGATDIGLDTSDTGRGAIEVRADQPSPGLR